MLERITRVNAQIIVAYILAFQIEISLAPRYRIETIMVLKQLAEFHNPKSFREMTRQDIVDFLDRLRKPESVDPLHRWKGSYELERIMLMRFFKWMHCPDPESTPPRQRIKPAVVQNIPKIKRTEKDEDFYKSTDVWTPEEDLLFCKYCPSKRDRAYFRVARDTGCRPDEMVRMKIKDLIEEPKGNEGAHVATIRVKDKTGPRRSAHILYLSQSEGLINEWSSFSKRSRRSHILRNWQEKHRPQNKASYYRKDIQ